MQLILGLSLTSLRLLGRDEEAPAPAATHALLLSSIDELDPDEALLLSGDEQPDEDALALSGDH